MADIYSLAGRARGKLVQEASRKDPHLRCVLGHAILLGYLFIELSATESTWSESDAQDEVVGGPKEDRCDREDSDDSDSDSGSDLDWGLDSGTYSDTDSDSDSDSGSEWHSYDYSADVESATRDWAQIERWEKAKPTAGGQPIQASVHEAPRRDRELIGKEAKVPRRVAEKSSGVGAVSSES